MKGLWFSIWAASCVSLGLFMAYVDGVNMRGIIGSAMIWSVIIAGVIAATFVFHLLKRKRSGRQGERKEAMNAVDMKGAAMMIGGAGIGTVIGSTLFAELYAMIASGIVGCAATPFIAKWLDRRMGE